MSVGTLVAEVWLKQRLAAAMPSVEIKMFPAPGQKVGVTIRFVARGPVRRGSDASREIFEEFVYEVAATADKENQYQLAPIVEKIKQLDRKTGYATDTNGVTLGKVIECLHEGAITLPYKAESGITRQRTGYQFRIRTQATESEPSYVVDDQMDFP